MQGLYESLRLELGRDGVHVGVVSPSFVDTPLRQRVLGPDGQPWPEPPAVPLPMFPVEKCVDVILRLIVKRRAQAILPWRSSLFLKLEQVLGPWIGDRILCQVSTRLVSGMKFSSSSSAKSVPWPPEPHPAG